MALERLFDACEAVGPAPSEDFLARLVADAEALLPPPPLRDRPREPGFGWLARFFAASGLSGAAALGVWLGFVMPDVVGTMAADLAGDDSALLTTFLPGADLAALDQ